MRLLIPKNHSYKTHEKDTQVAADYSSINGFLFPGCLFPVQLLVSQKVGEKNFHKFFSSIFVPPRNRVPSSICTFGY